MPCPQRLQPAKIRRAAHCCQRRMWIEEIAIRHDFHEIRLELLIKSTMTGRILFHIRRLRQGIRCFRTRQEMKPEAHRYAIHRLIIQCCLYQLFF